MYQWLARTCNISNESTDKNKYGLQMSLTLSNHPLLEKYREDIRASNQKKPSGKYAAWLLSFKCDIPKGRQDFPTIIVKGNQSSNKIYLLLPSNIMDYFNDESSKLKEALTDETYYGRSIYIKDSEYNEVDPSLFKPFKVDSGTKVEIVDNPALFWNIPLIFVGFEDVDDDGTYDLFVDILRSNPIGKDISSIQFLEYMSQPVVSWVKSVSDKENNGKNSIQNEATG